MQCQRFTFTEMLIRLKYPVSSRIHVHKMNNNYKRIKAITTQSTASDDLKQSYASMFTRKRIHMNLWQCKLLSLWSETAGQCT